MSEKTAAPAKETILLLGAQCTVTRGLVLSNDYETQVGRVSFESLTINGVEYVGTAYLETRVNNFGGRIYSDLRHVRRAGNDGYNAPGMTDKARQLLGEALDKHVIPSFSAPKFKELEGLVLSEAKAEGRSIASSLLHKSGMFRYHDSRRGDLNKSQLLAAMLDGFNEYMEEQ